ncbi:hypothetical protein RSOL_301480 [Rhizoctonia solani AG-3 Rhs1AP]|uniref:Uncharacterized protein n=2 Tax=Rhizoctonia solani AG-3 TaxID=1086053 RepID=A0A074RNG0_9AGAM|nr:hypothetical protein RSOL_301480 [Rhizoctonia solani AG-3 Rhs1AP]KEP48616.1 hypothetical protein V565_120070 [Rhizoctonia solani 123E]
MVEGRRSMMMSHSTKQHVPRHPLTLPPPVIWVARKTPTHAPSTIRSLWSSIPHPHDHGKRLLDPGVEPLVELDFSSRLGIRILNWLDRPRTSPNPKSGGV